MKKIIFIILLNILCLGKIFASDSIYNNFHLRAGGSLNLTVINTQKFINYEEEDDDEEEDDEKEDEHKSAGLGIYSSINYRFIDWEIGFFSDFLIGPMSKSYFVWRDSSIIGSGHHRMINLGPNFRYHTPFNPLNKANVYIGFGPSWSLQTFVFNSKSITTGDFTAKKRISFENYGGTFYLGLEQLVSKKSEHPWFIELVYSYMHSYKASILDATNSVDVITLSEGDSNDYSAHYFMLRAGVTLF